MSLTRPGSQRGGEEEEYRYETNASFHCPGNLPFR